MKLCAQSKFQTLSPDCHQPTLLPCLCPKWWSFGTFWPTLQQQSCGWRYYQLKLQYPGFRTTIPLCNRVFSLGLALWSAVHEHPKNSNNFCTRIFWPYLHRHKQKPNTSWIIWQKTLLLIFTQIFGSQFFQFFRSGITPACWGLTLRRRFPYILGTTSDFNLTWRKIGWVHTLINT